MDNNGYTHYNDPFEPRQYRQEPNGSPLRARDHRARARDLLRGFWGIAILVTFVAALLGGVASSGPSFRIDIDTNFSEQQIEEFYQIPGATDTDLGISAGRYMQMMRFFTERFPFLPFLISFFSMLAMVQFVVGGPVMLGYNRFKLHRLDGQEAQFSDLFSAFDRFLDGLWMRVRIFLQVLGWTLLLIIPGIVAAYRYALIPYLMADHPDMSVGEAFERSKALMNGRKWDLFCLDLSFIGWWILCGFTFGILSLWITPYSQMARTSFYRSLCPAPAAEPETDYEW